MIIGTDLMNKLNMDLLFSTNEIVWEGYNIQMKEKGTISSTNKMEAMYHSATQSPILSRAEKRQNTILDANYEKIELVDVAKEQWQHLSYNEKKLLMKVLTKLMQ